MRLLHFLHFCLQFDANAKNGFYTHYLRLTQHPIYTVLTSFTWASACAFASNCQQCIYGLHQTQRRMDSTPILCVWRNVLINTMISYWRKCTRRSKHWHSCEWTFTPYTYNNTRYKNCIKLSKDNFLIIGMRIRKWMEIQLNIMPYTGLNITTPTIKVCLQLTSFSPFY